MRSVTAMVAAACLVLSGCTVDDPAAAPQDGAVQAELVNPVIETDFADPDVVVTADGLVAYATGVPGSSAIQVTESRDDPDTWSDPADALPERPDWQPLQEGLTWAPDVMERDGTWWMYYVARDSDSGHLCLSRAAGQTPLVRSWTTATSRSFASTTSAARSTRRCSPTRTVSVVVLEE